MNRPSIHSTTVGIATASAVVAAVLLPVAPAGAAPERPTTSVATRVGFATDAMRQELQELEGTQSSAEIDRIVDSGHLVATYTAGTSSTIVAAVDLGPAQRALSFVGPGCSTDSLCMTNTSNSPSAYTGTGSLSGTWKRITSAAAYGRKARFTWDGGALTVEAGHVNYFGAPVTMKKVSR
ncbi:hypothetical protein DEJ34_14045 [Curtobacterium sp. MCPF17_050]|uniref:hypothetical protein n=1 Tax=Curtobacterium sp. MCPF17_050 TaxID=2175664 RepID=UPI0011B79985|nr:hypothetical protein [Curtobacterium sp. MCPF17_050]WIB15240.1 hypothetical protein DEJ34_14045 [Curtobacterium sp. MCPF17_050]